MKVLRQNGIYKIPGIQRRVYLVANGENTYFLYDCEYGAKLPPRFSVTAYGHIINWFNDFPVWTIDDLIDTGETYENN